MRRRTALFYISNVLLLTAISRFSVASDPVHAAMREMEGFRIYDATWPFNGKPDLSKHGIGRCSLSYAHNLWPSSHRRDAYDRPDIDYIRRKHIPEKFNEQRPDLHVIDIEHWPTQLSKNGADAVSDTISRFKKVIGVFREAIPSIPLGIYSMIPVRNYWAPVVIKKDQLIAWERDNDFLAPLAAAVDVIFPSLYTFYDDPIGWQVYAKANLEQAHRYGKPVIPFIWPRYHGSNRFIGGQPVSRGFWRIQLETVREFADGVVIWGARRDELGPAEGWMIETLAMADALREQRVVPR